MKALLLRVGIDKGCGGALAPIFEDGSFEYIPIPEQKINKRDIRTFANTRGVYGGYMAEYLPEKTRNKKIHFDPEFETFTYGDTSHSKNNYLLKLEKNDLLVFYAGLTPYKNEKFQEALYLIGYLVVEMVIDFNEFSASKKSDLEKIEKLYAIHFNNAHLKTNDLENLVMVVGNSKSRLLNHAILISQQRPDKRGRKYHVVSPEMEKLLGIKGSIQRSIPPRMITEDIYLENLKKLINYSV